MYFSLVGLPSFLSASSLSPLTNFLRIIPLRSRIPAEESTLMTSYILLRRFLLLSSSSPTKRSKSCLYVTNWQVSMKSQTQLEIVFRFVSLGIFLPGFGIRLVEIGLKDCFRCFFIGFVFEVLDFFWGECSDLEARGGCQLRAVDFFCADFNSLKSPSTFLVSCKKYSYQQISSSQSQIPGPLTSESSSQTPSCSHFSP